MRNRRGEEMKGRRGDGGVMRREERNRRKEGIKRNRRGEEMKGGRGDGE